jgi:dimethylglycine dehydrogenase
LSKPETRAAIAIIGGGIVGVATAYHLTKTGAKDVLLLARSELTSGATWYAAGNLPHFHGSYAVMRLQQYGKALYRTLAEDAGQAVDLSWTGALRLAHAAERVGEFERVAAFARHLRIDMRVITPTQAAEHFPGLVPGFVATPSRVGTILAYCLRTCAGNS